MSDRQLIPKFPPRDEACLQRFLERRQMTSVHGPIRRIQRYFVESCRVVIQYDDGTVKRYWEDNRGRWHLHWIGKGHFVWTKEDGEGTPYNSGLSRTELDCQGPV